MNNFTSHLKEVTDMTNYNHEENFHYKSVQGNENVIEVSIIDKGEKLSVLFETFSDQQYKLFERLKNDSQAAETASDAFEMPSRASAVHCD